MKKKLKKPIKDQQEIWNAILNKEYIKLWHKIKYIGCDLVRSPDMRKLVMLQAVNEFDMTKNNNFAAFYKQSLSFTNKRIWNMRTQRVTQCRSAIAAHREYQNWPTSHIEKPINAQHDILINWKA